MSAGWYQKGDKQLHSTWRVCRKALTLNRSVGDHAALLRRVRFEFRQAVFSENVEEARLFRSLLSEMGHRNLVTDAIFLLGKLPLPLAFFRRLYHRLRYGNG